MLYPSSTVHSFLKRNRFFKLPALETEQSAVLTTELQKSYFRRERGGKKERDTALSKLLLFCVSME